MTPEEIIELAKKNKKEPHKNNNMFDNKKFKKELKKKRYQDCINKINSSEILYSQSFMKDFFDDENYKIRNVFDRMSVGYDSYITFNDILMNGMFSIGNCNCKSFKIKFKDFTHEFQKTLCTLLKFNFFKSNKKDKYDDNIYLNNSSIISFCNTKEDMNIKFIYHVKLLEEYNTLISLIENCYIEDNESHVYMVKPTPNDIELIQYDFKDKIFDIKIDYNNDFVEIDKKIKSFDLDTTGLILFHGEPGCGKSTYISHLCNYYKKDRKVIYIPSAYLDLLNDSRMHELLNENKNAIVILEDSENVLTSRDNLRNNMVQTLLNYTDGILADIFKPIFISTFNCDISKIDKALLRKGRCLVKYEFKKLEKSKAQKLSDRLGFNNIIKEDMSLADIYNQDDTKYENEKMVFTGFKLKSA